MSMARKKTIQTIIPSHVSLSCLISLSFEFLDWLDVDFGIGFIFSSICFSYWADWALTFKIYCRLNKIMILKLKKKQKSSKERMVKQNVFSFSYEFREQPLNNFLKLINLKY